MYFENGFFYAGEPVRPLKVECAEPLENYRLRLRFSDGAEKIFDARPLLEMPLYEPLKDEGLFNRVYLDFGIPTWKNGEIDIAVETLYEDAVSL